MDDITLGGPPLDLFNSDLRLSQESVEHDTEQHNKHHNHPCHDADKLYDRMQQAIDCVCTTDNSGTTGSLCQAVKAGNLINTVPFSSMVDLITGPYSECGAVIPEDKRQEAYNTFVSITGYKPFDSTDLSQIVSLINDNRKSMANFTAVYIFLILFTLCAIVILLLVLFELTSWPVGLLLLVLVFFILFTLSLVYSFSAQKMIDNNSTQVTNTISNNSNNFQNTVAYWPQGLFGVASALTNSATGGTGAVWPCNNINTCTNKITKQELSIINNRDSSNLSSLLSSKLPLSELSIEDIDLIHKVDDSKHNNTKDNKKLKHIELLKKKRDSLIKKPDRISKKYASKLPKLSKLTRKLHSKSQRKNRPLLGPLR